MHVYSSIVCILHIYSFNSLCLYGSIRSSCVRVLVRGLFDAVTVVVIIVGEVASSVVVFFVPPFLLEGVSQSHPIAVVLLCLILRQ